MPSRIGGNRLISPSAAEKSAALRAFSRPLAEDPRRLRGHCLLPDGTSTAVTTVIGSCTVTKTSVDLRHRDPRGRGHALHAATLAGALLLALGAATAVAQSPQPADDAIQEFVTATREYAWMHRRLEHALPPLTPTTVPETIGRGILELAAAIRAERPDAGQGDLFTPALAPVLRSRIAAALSDHGLTPDDVRARDAEGGVAAAAVSLRVNGAFPWVVGSAMVPCLGEALPPLPPELQYRIVGSDLVLVDVHASLIVDMLPRALAETTFDLVEFDRARR